MAGEGEGIENLAGFPILLQRRVLAGAGIALLRLVC